MITRRLWEKIMDEGGLFVTLGIGILLFTAGSCMAESAAYEKMCHEDVLPHMTTLSDSLDIAQKYDECEWWGVEG